MAACVPRPQLLAKAADALSLGDGATRRVRMQQNWALMPFACVIGSVYPASYMRGSRFAFGLHPGAALRLPLPGCRIIALHLPEG